MYWKLFFPFFSKYFKIRILNVSFLQLSPCCFIFRWYSGKESTRQCRKCKRHRFEPWRRKWQPTPVFLPGIYHGQSSLGATVHVVIKRQTRLSRAQHLSGGACAHAQLLSHDWLFVIPWTVARQAPLSMGFSRLEFWSQLQFLQGIFLTQGLNLHFLCLLHWQVDPLPLSHLGSIFS